MSVPTLTTEELAERLEKAVHAGREMADREWTKRLAWAAIVVAISHQLLI